METIRNWSEIIKDLGYIEILLRLLNDQSGKNYRFYIESTDTDLIRLPVPDALTPMFIRAIQVSREISLKELEAYDTTSRMHVKL